MAIYRENDNGRFTVHRYYFMPTINNNHAQLVLDIKLGEGPEHFILNGPGYDRLIPDIHYAAVRMYGEIAEAMAEQLKADGVTRGPWEEA